MGTDEKLAPPATEQPSKAQEASADRVVEPSDPAPAYADSVEAGPSATPAAAAAVGSSTVPTVEEPFNFPSSEALPPYTPAADESKRPVAVPQVNADAASPFLSAYPPILLSYGITDETWRSFLNTMSAFLTAKISDRALHHATDIAKHIGNGPKHFGKDVAANAKSVGKNIAQNAKRGNIIGAAAGVIGGAISIPISVALGATGVVLGSTVGAITKKPQTPYERALTYAAVANKKWFNVRGLQAQLLHTKALAQLLGVTVPSLLDSAKDSKQVGTLEEQVQELEIHIARLQVEAGPPLVLQPNTLWLVLVPIARQI